MPRFPILRSFSSRKFKASQRLPEEVKSETLQSRLCLV